MMKIIKASKFFVAFILIFSCKIDTKQTQSLADYFLELETLYEMKKYTECYNRTYQFVLENPKIDEGWSLLSGACLALRIDSLDSICMNYVNITLELNENNYSANLNKAILLDRKRNYDSARIFYNKAMILEPKNAKTYSNLAGNRLRAKDYGNAVKYGELAVGFANKIEDKAVLSISYHYHGELAKRDSLFHLLEYVEYENARQLYNLFYEHQ